MTFIPQLFFFGYFSSCLCNANSDYLPDPKTYTCSNGVCLAVDIGTKVVGAKTLDVCRLTCDPDMNLWPKPRGNSNFANRQLKTVALFKVQVVAVSEKPANFDGVVAIFKALLNSTYGKNVVDPNDGMALTVQIQITKTDSEFKIFHTDESYSLAYKNCDDPNTVTVSINSKTIFGARHALESLSQLIVLDEISKTLQTICGISLTDSPAFPYRGISFDVSRHFYPIESLMHLIDAMSYNKMNVLHLHLADAQSFPLHIPKWPQMTKYGAYSASEIYSLSDLMKLKSHGLNRGVVIVPEIDAPSHVGYGWQWGNSTQLGDLLLCFSKRPNDHDCFGTPCGYLNLANPNIYIILNEIWHNITAVFGQNTAYHIGGDEVKLYCWQHDMQIQNWLKNRNLTASSADLHKVWGEFETNVVEMIQNNLGQTDSKVFLWSSSMTKEFRTVLNPIKNKIVVESWDMTSSSAIPDLVKDNFSVIVSPYDVWYLNCGFPWWVGEGPNRCSPVKGWREMYNNRPYKGLHGNWNITDPVQQSNILGGEVGLWSEITDATNMDSDVWPRTAAVAERLWADPSHCWWEANNRFLSHRDRLKSRGVNAEPLAPSFCTQNPQHCIIPPDLWIHFQITSTCQEFQQVSTSTQQPTTATPSGSKSTQYADISEIFLLIPAFVIMLR